MHAYIHTYIHAHIHTYTDHTCYCIHTCIHTYRSCTDIHIDHTYMLLHTYMPTCMHAYTDTYMHAYRSCTHTGHVCIRTYIHTIHTFTHACIQVLHTDIHSCIDTYMHTYIHHTYTQIIHDVRRWQTQAWCKDDVRTPTHAYIHNLHRLERRSLDAGLRQMVETLLMSVTSLANISQRCWH